MNSDIPIEQLQESLLSKGRSLLDPYGVLVNIGRRVAYNCQGEVRKGQVVGIKVAKNVNKWDWLTIEVREDSTGKISKVSRPSNLIVLNETA